VPDDIKIKLAVAPGVSQLVRWGTPQGNAAEYKWPCMEGEILASIFPLLAHKMDRVQPLRPRLSELD
jgi:hypothetical protein